MTFNYTVLLVSSVLLVCVMSSKLSYRIGVPVLIVFLGIGMLVGSDGIGFVYFDNPAIAQYIGSTALAFILFTGGMDTKWTSVKPVIKSGLVLATVGVLGTAIFVGVFTYFVTDMTIWEGLLLGAIVSSTDAATVFSILKSKSLNLKGDLVPLLEFESGSNDPMAYMITVILVSIITTGESSLIAFILMFTRQMIIGGILGYVLARLFTLLINYIKLDYDGLYYVFLIATVYLIFAIVSILDGNGFLAMYVAGIVFGNTRYIHKRSLIKFFDGQTWLMQITLFVTLGLLVFPSQLPSVAGKGLIISSFIIFVARPVCMFILMSFFEYSFKEKLLVSWVGFRGAASIVFAIIPYMEGLPVANEIFNIVFFIVLTSVVIQGTLFPIIARKLGLVEMVDDTILTRSFNEYADEINGVFAELLVLPNSPMLKKKIVEIKIPQEVLVISIHRDDKYIVPKGLTMIKENDKLLVTAESEEHVKDLEERFAVKMITNEPSSIDFKGRRNEFHIVKGDIIKNKRIKIKEKIKNKTS
ncbi:potassium/proton antiporter [Tissierella sp. MSJ-40]|uniref:Potassium/proton antiporter n=1 Tax=Tissierella simiarum TaxID=2841534 RepID=A0ABS6E536_9FIRM|nr:potassium/proton antiporter [Tissierella simiarum]MBU5438033.1 potassium/proton antiporter [Tissierella simiarum]